MRFRVKATFALMSLSLFAAGAAGAQDAATWPSRTVRIVVPTTAGGGNDAAARHLGDFLTRHLGKPFVVDNVPGAGNIAGTTQVARAKPDGYTILSTGVTAITVSPHLYPAVTYKPDELVPVSMLNESSQVLVVSPQKLKVKTLPDLIAELKANPGRYNYGSNGIGSIGHLAMELFKIRTGTSVSHVPFKGGGDVVTALLGGHVELAFNNTTSVLGQLRDGSLTAIAVPAAARVEELPGTPLLSDTVPTFGAFSSWVGILAPPKTPDAIVQKLHAGIAAYAATKEAAEFTKASGARLVASRPEEFSAAIKRDSGMWSEVIKSIGLTLN